MAFVDRAVTTAAHGVKDTVRSIEEDIIFGRLRPRERLVEDDLMARFGRKRHIVRQALSELEKLGIVRRERNKGAVVRDFTPQNVEEIYDIRALLQAHAARLVPLPAAAGLVSELAGIHHGHAAAVAADDLRAVYHLNNQFHEELFEACGNAYLADAINHYAWLAHAIRSYRMADPTLLAQAVQEHDAMLRALEAGDREGLVRLCVEHILPSKRAYLAQETRPAATAPPPTPRVPDGAHACALSVPRSRTAVDRRT